MRKHIVSAAVIGAAALGTFTLGGVANAAPAGKTAVISNSTAMYSEATTTSTVVGTISRGTEVTAQCYAFGENYHGNFYWFKIADGTRVGFVHRGTILGVDSSIPRC